MGFFGIDSKSTSNTYAQQTAASEGSLAVGAGGKYLEAGSLDFTGASNPQLGPKLNAGGDISVTTADPDVLKTALNQIGDLSRSQTSAFSSYAKQLQEEKTGDLATLLKSLGDLKETTDEQAQQRKSFLYLTLAILGVLALLFFPWKTLKL
jgi:hypothetical protein